jgi:signal transduction histidine kinase
MNSSLPSRRPDQDKVMPMNSHTSTVPRFLVVDDNELQLKALCESMKEESYAVECCTDPNQALAHLRDGAVDILLTDLKMPQTSGIDLIRAGLERNPDLVSVVITGQGSISTAVEAMKVGAVDYVQKPFRLEQFLPVLARAAELSRLRNENRRLQARVARRTEELEAANRELQAFAGRIAHDLREPVSIMRSLTSLIEERHAQALPAEAQTYLRYIGEAGARSDRLIRDLLDFARLGERPLTLQEVDLNLVVDRVRAALDRAEGPAVEWHIGPLCTVQGDGSLLQQVFANLLSNARKYSRHATPPRIEVRCEPHDEGWRITVRDNGVGFNPEQAGRLFTPFQRLHSADQFEGNGMGLANVKRIVDKHGGLVEAHSQPGQGSVFTVVLPERTDDAATR